MKTVVLNLKLGVTMQLCPKSLISEILRYKHLNVVLI